MKFRVLDLFSGAGGFSSGVDKNEKFKTVIGVDFDKSAIETFKNNFPEAKTILGDLTKKDIKKTVVEEARNLGVNMVVGGPPCQGFSLKGKLKGIDDPRNFLFREFLRIVKDIKPEVFVIENVKNLIKAQDGFFINQIKKEFEKENYIINIGIMNSSHFGVPQIRERAIIIGSLSRSITLPSGNKDNLVTVREAISDLAYLSSGEGSEDSQYQLKVDSNYQEERRGARLYNHTVTNHTPETLRKLNMIPPEGDKSYLPKKYHGKQKFTTTWSRLIWDKPSPTIDTRFDTPSNGRNTHPELHRAITPREAARIQSFDDDFKFFGGKTSVCRQIGNAVPPLMAKSIADKISEAYSEKKEVSSRKEYVIYQADSFSKIKEFKKENLKVDHIITDPPYNISQTNNFHTLDNPRKGVDFGNWDRSFDLLGWIDSYTKLLKPNGSIIIFCSYKFLSHIVDRMESNNIVVKDVIVWKKSNPMPRNINRRYVQDMEFAIWGVNKKAKWVFNKDPKESYMRSMFETSTVSGKERTAHPTQKSIKLMEKIIRIHTNKNDVIIDPFMGSGTTGAAAINLDRKFVGIESNPRYFDIASTRLKKIISSE